VEYLLVVEVVEDLELYVPTDLIGSFRLPNDVPEGLPPSDKLPKMYLHCKFCAHVSESSSSL
jgi:hypothetical protein